MPRCTASSDSACASLTPAYTIFQSHKYPVHHLTIIRLLGVESLIFGQQKSGSVILTFAFRYCTVYHMGQNRMQTVAEAPAEGSWLPLTFYMDKHVVSGALYQPSSLRLTDALNQLAEKQGNSAGSFIEVRDSRITHEGAGDESQPSAFLNKNSIILATAEDGDTARGIGASAGPKRYPFVQKHTVQVVVETEDYTISGSIHCAAGQQVRDVLGQPTAFLPLTDVHIESQGQHIRHTAPFAALNRSQILSLAQEKAFM